MTRSTAPRSGTRPRAPLVLLVEDHDATRGRCAAELSSAGFMVIDAADGATAIEKATRFVPHAIVLDLVLPGIDGFKVARHLRSQERTRDLAIIAVTALASRQAEMMALGAGCDLFLSKPVPSITLVGHLVRLIARRTHDAGQVGTPGAGAR